ncbi:MAG: multidrug effflux MFS transporter [Rubellimicrobium sp.]|nr:multidrug effflux MFS transporter [Rubellimicrobium sp.]
MTATATRPRLSTGEFVALMAMLTATVAFSIDSMLPALPEIARELSPDAVNRAQLILTSFVFGMGLGTLFVGPMADAWGRRPALFGGAALYCLGAVLAWSAPTLEIMLAARLLQGLGAAAPRVVAVAMIRDQFEGREMARILSFVMIIFTLVPAMAPLLGSFIIAGFGWRAIFGSFLVFSVISMVWLALRQGETLDPANRRPLQVRLLWAGLREVLANPTTRLSIAVQTLVFGMLFSVLSSTQQVFDLTYGRGPQFPWWFAGISLVSGTAGFVNAKLVMRLGMRAIIRMALAGQMVISTIMIAAILSPLPPEQEFVVYLVWTTSVFFQSGLMIGNLNALGMEPMGRLAGFAASVIASLATVGSVLIAAPIALSYDGTAMPIAIGTLVAAFVARLLASRIRRGA